MALPTKTFNSPLVELLPQLLGQKQTTSSSSQGTANTQPLQQVFQQASQPMDMQLYETMIKDIASQASRQVPTITSALANATGTRSTGNSPLALALKELEGESLNRGAQQVLQFNQNAQGNAVNAARGIADATRGTTQQQTQKSGFAQSPVGAAALGWGLNQLDKRGVFDKVGDVASSGLDAVNSLFSSPAMSASDVWSVMGEGAGGALPSADVFSNFSAPDGMDFSGFTDPLAGFGAGVSDFFGGAGDVLGGVADWGGDILGDIGGGISDFFGGIGDFFGFADGGMPGSQTRGQGMIPARTAAPMQVADSAAMGMDPNKVMQMILMQSMMKPAMAAPAPNPLNFIRYLMPTSDFNIYQYANGGRVNSAAQPKPGIGYADGGRVRNLNYMGGPLARTGMNAVDLTSFGASGGSGAGVNSSGIMDISRMTRENIGIGRGSSSIPLDERMRMLSGVSDAGLDAPSNPGAGTGTAAQNAAAMNAFAMSLAAPAIAALGIPPAVVSAITSVPSFPAFAFQQIAKPVVSALAPTAPAAPTAPGAVGGSGDGSSIGAVGDAEGAVSSPVGDSSVEGFSIGDATAPSAGGPGGPGSAGDGTGPGGSGASGSGVGASGSAASGVGGDSGVGGVGAYSQGGKIRGPGTGTSDSIMATSRIPGESPVRFSNGEFIFSKQATDFYGPEMLTRMLMAAHTPVRG